MARNLLSRFIRYIFRQPNPRVSQSPTEARSDDRQQRGTITRRGDTRQRDPSAQRVDGNEGDTTQEAIKRISKSKETIEAQIKDIEEKLQNGECDERERKKLEAELNQKKQIDENLEQQLNDLTDTHGYQIDVTCRKNKSRFKPMAEKAIQFNQAMNFRLPGQVMDDQP